MLEKYETMNLSEFKNSINEINNIRQLWLGKNILSEKAKCLHLLKEKSGAIIENFTDKDLNFLKWLCGSSCILHHPYTGKNIEIKIASENIEGIYYFLRYCMKLNRTGWVDEDLQAFLASII